MFDPHLWFMFPTGILVAILGISAGISGSNFWIPIYMIWLGFEPKVGFWLSLFTMLFGFGSGVVKNVRQKTIHWPLVRAYLVFCLPAGMIGGFLSPFAPQDALILLFAVFVLLYGSWLLVRSGKEDNHTPHEKPVRALALTAGFLQGLIATGLGKLMLNNLLGHKQIKHHADAVGSTVLIVFLVSLAAVVTRLNSPFLNTLAEQRDLIVSVMIWVAPGVVIGGQIGPVVSGKIPKRFVKPYVGALLLLVSGLMFYRVFGG